MTKNQTAISYRPDIDGLRAISVLAVVIFHFFPTNLKGGFTGVDVFFVISGFLVTSIILNSSNTSFSFSSFYSRRVKRLFPSLILVLSSVLAISYLVLISKDFQFLGKHIFGGVFFIDNIFYFYESGYFDQASELKPLLHLWSLSLEEQFYLFWPPILLLIKKVRHKFAVRTLLLLIITSFSMNVLMIKNNQSFSFFMLPTRLWELALGGLIPFLMNQNSNKFFVPKIAFEFFRTKGPILGIFIILAGFIFIKDEKYFPGFLALIPVIGTCLVIIGNRDSIINKFLSNKFLVTIGLISYPLYLWHWPLISIPTLVFGKISAHFKIVLILISVSLAFGSYRLELHIKKSSFKFMTPILLAFLLLISGLGGIIYLKDGIPSRNSELEELLKSQTAYKDSFETLQSQKCKEKYLNTQMCSVRFHDREPTIALIGDSHANHVFPGFLEYYKNTDENLILLAESGTPPLSKIVSKRSPDMTLNSVFEYILQKDSIHTVILSAFWENFYDEKGVLIDNYIYKNKIFDPQNPNEASQNKIFETGLKRTFELLKNKKIIFVYSLPSLPFNLKRCSPNILEKHPRHCSFDYKHVENQNEYRSITDPLMNKVNIERKFDLVPYVCNNNSCSIIKNNQFLYSDDFHLSEIGSINFWKNSN